MDSYSSLSLLQWEKLTKQLSIDGGESVSYERLARVGYICMCHPKSVLQDIANKPHDVINLIRRFSSDLGIVVRILNQLQRPDCVEIIQTWVPRMYSFIYSFIHSFIYSSFVYSCIHTWVHLCTHLFIYTRVPCMYSFIHSFIHPYIHSYLGSLYVLIHSINHSFIRTRVPCKYSYNVLAM